MKKMSLLLLIMVSFSVSGQMEIEAKELSKKEIRALKKQKSFEKQKARYAKRGLNDWGINENAPNLVVAVREHLGSARIDFQKGLVISQSLFQMVNPFHYGLLTDSSTVTLPTTSPSKIFVRLLSMKLWQRPTNGGNRDVRVLLKSRQ